MKPRYVEIRGGTGAGKSTLVRELRTYFSTVREEDPWVGRWPHPELGGVRVAVPGRYDVATGGLENRYTLEECVALLSDAQRHAPVIVFEGGMISKTTGHVYQWLREQDAEYICVHLALGIKQVYRNLCGRRKKITLSEPQMKSIDRDHDTVVRAVVRMKIDGVKVYTEPTYSAALEQVLALIKETH